MATAIRRRWMENIDVLAGLAMVMIVVMMVVPLPAHLLDVLITINITGAVLTLMLAIFTKDPLEFSVLPSLLLVMTLFRLSLNVAATKLILLDGHAGDVIQQFGQFVVRGNAVVGFIVFVILVIVQFIVITKGAERISEVVARFTLDAMPGKQMAIDADMNSGLINEQGAKDRRKKIQQEADFYGAMDGASKFVKGDAIAAIIILVINIIGGFVIGVVMKDMAILEALNKYTLLTIGDGLVSQIPALLISTSTGLVVTRAASENNLGQDIARQMFRAPRALFITGGVLIALALFGLPKIPLFIVAAFLVISGLMIQRSMRAAADKETETASEIELEDSKKPENVVAALHVDNMEIELGYALIALVDANRGGDFMERVVLIRRQIAAELGFIVPVIRIRDNMNLTANQYVIKLRGAEVAGGDLLADHYLCMSSGFEDDSIPGTPTKEPAFGLDAKWINIKYREQAETAGCTVVDAPTVLATHLTEVIKIHAGEILTRQDVKMLVDNVREYAPAIVEELIPDLLNLGQIQKILSNLLRERVSIKDLMTVLETLADYSVFGKDIDRLTEYARQSLSRQIVQALIGKEKELRVLTLDPQLEQQILNNIQPAEFGSFVNLDPNLIQRLVKNISKETEKMMLNGYVPVMVCAPMVRINLKKMTERQLPQLVVLSYNELIQGIEVQAVGMVNADES
ncbi:MAG: flagellar biosynthesis protein FlhA [Peptococcaceae bacterium]|nr:flagellar biosynthesis protein FlhA [Peptococcaceae bacterium]